MKQQITAESFRKDKIAEFETVRDWVTKNFETFWKLAEEARTIGDKKSFGIETKFGNWQFIANPFSDKD